MLLKITIDRNIAICYTLFGIEQTLIPRRLKMERRYDGCDAITETFPDEKNCGRPVRIDRAKSAFVRCENHPVKKLWPENDPITPAQEVR